MTQKPANPERSTELFFELASVDRKEILSELQKENLHLNEVAARAGMTATETLRQLQRMTEAGLLEKMPDGRYKLTSYAKVVIGISSPLDFVSRYREYFLSHDASLLPPENLARLGELAEGELTTSYIETINKVTEMLGNARQTIDWTLEVGLDAFLEIMLSRLREGVKIRWLLHESFLPKAKSILRSAEKFPEMRWTQHSLVHINLTENVGAFSLRQNSGGMSDTAFFGEDPSFLRWINDLYVHQWQEAKPWYP